ncbi:chemotaxis protein CheB [Rhodanobacter sp. C03]|uniref:chemotaxis protein CheB n=1 Tax=Rhodanobacter sp. C03 TaxID=1945858 RepID=UPI0009871803|nr:chemotaxis protein CheB [Rhodanobacter sp. C03]OOG54389.1 chemotaxis protein CheB [Rhodanobacter sp. C03]
MTDTTPAVALLFDDTVLGGQLREALHERGARIVHEGGVASLNRELLHQVGADVLVVNLDDSADDALDHLYELIDGDRPRVVFNDAQASRNLNGWDRARWARHLAVKVLAAGDLDPPRPEDARGIETPAPVGQPESAHIAAVTLETPAEAAAAFAETAPVPAESGIEEHAPATEPTPEAESESMLLESDLLPHDDLDGQYEKSASAESENLAAELEALLASDELHIDADDASGPGLRFTSDEELPPLHDGDFGVLPTPTEAGAGHHAASFTAAATLPQAAAFQLDHLQLASQDDPSIVTLPASANESAPVASMAAPVSAPDSWALLDDDVLLAEPTRTDAAAFGVEKLSAADFLAPDVGPVAPGVEAVMNLELMSIEEAIAPTPYLHDHDGHDHVMMLDELGGALSRLVLLGAAPSGADSVCSFLAALPASSRLTFLHTQHLGEQESDAVLAQRLAAVCPLPVRLAEQGSRATSGEVLLVPAGKQVILRRDGKIELQAIASDQVQGPSIDTSFTMAANAFGRDAVAIVFAGRANDAVAGSQAIHDRGGQVWVESSSGEHFADMVSGIFAERLVSFSGTPHELAAHLIEVFP